MKFEEDKSTAWVIVKSVKVRNRDGEVIGSLRFGQLVYVFGKPKNGRIGIKVTKLYDANTGSTKRTIPTTGYIPVKALTTDTVHDLAGLYHTNITGKRIPVSATVGGEVAGYILPHEKVKAFAVCKGWCLTSKGWTMFKWLKKTPIDIEYGSGRELADSILCQAAKDYTNAVKRLKKGQLFREQFMDTMAVLDEVTWWFANPRSNYIIYFEHGTGRERLEWLNENLGIDQKWLDEKHRILNELKHKGYRRWRRT